MVKFYTLGTSHGGVEVGRSCSVNMVSVGEYYYIFDCGGNVETKLKDMGIPFENIKAVFISHMHEDHVGSLSAIVKRFSHYIKEERSVNIFMPEDDGIKAFKGWMSALHTTENLHRIEYTLISEGVIYTDDHIKVTAIRTRHLFSGKFPSYAFMIEAEGKRLLYTGDLAYDFSDYPAILYTEKFDLVVSELVHFSLDDNLADIKRTNTKHLVFTHMGPTKALALSKIVGDFPFRVDIAEDNDIFDA